MTRTLKFYGASDDLFEIDGTIPGEPDEIGCFGSVPTVKVALADDVGVFVTANYGPNNSAATWMMGISQLDEDLPLPDWPMRWSAPGGRGYSVLLEIDVPEGVTVTNVSI